MRKSDFCLCENKGSDQLRSNCEADQRLCFRYSDSTVQFLFFLNPEFQASSSVCVRPGRKPRRPVFSRHGSFCLQFMLLQQLHPSSVFVSGAINLSSREGEQDTLMFCLNIYDISDI